MSQNASRKAVDTSEISHVPRNFDGRLFVSQIRSKLQNFHLLKEIYTYIANNRRSQSCVYAWQLDKVHILPVNWPKLANYSCSSLCIEVSYWTIKTIVFVWEYRHRPADTPSSPPHPTKTQRLLTNTSLLFNQQKQDHYVAKFPETSKKLTARTQSLGMMTGVYCLTVRRREHTKCGVGSRTWIDWEKYRVVRSHAQLV